MTALVSRLLALLVIGIACVAALPSAVAATCDATARLTETKKIFGQIFSGDVVGLQSLPFTENNFTFSLYVLLRSLLPSRSRLTLDSSVDGLASVTLTPTKPVAVESTVIIAVVLFQGDNITYVDDGKATVTVNFVGVSAHAALRLRSR